MHGAHVCMSGVLECSGVDPCEPCTSAILTYVLVPAMKAAGIDQRNDPRVVRFLQTYAEARRNLVAGLLAQVAPPPPPPPVNPRPSHPPVADMPLTEAELEAMATPVSPETIAAPSAALVDAPMAGGAEEPPPPAPLPLTPAGLLSDDEFRARFPSAVPEQVIEGYTPPAPSPPPEPLRSERLTDDGTYPNVEEEKAKIAERASASKLPESEPSLLKLAAQAITPKLPADEPTSESSKVGSAPTEPAPSSAPQPKATTEDAASVSAVATPADSSTTKAEAHSHG